MADQTILVNVGANISNLTSGLNTASNQVSSFVHETQNGIKALGNLGKALVAIGVGAAVGIGYAVKVSADFESAFAGVKKTVDATDKELEVFRKGILAMTREMPASAEEIAGVAEAAGQLGIKNEAILGFTKTMVNMGVATNMSSDEAATALARLANITQMPQDKFENLGSTIVALGNNFATTEKEIVDMSLRLAGQGKQIGLTEAQIAALATAMSSVGIEAEAGGTAMSTIMKKIQNAVGKGGKSLEGFAKTAGMSSAQFKQAFEKDATSAILALVQGLGKSSAEGKNLTAILKDLGIKGIRESDTLLRLSGASNVLSDALMISSQAWEENSALANEAAERYKTFDSQLKMLRNTIKYIVMIIGDQFREVLTGVMKALQPLLNKIVKLAEGFAKLSPATRHFIAGGTMLVTVLMLVTGSILVLLGFLPAIIAWFGSIATMFGITSMALLKIVAISFGVVTAIILIISALVIAYNEIEWFRDGVNAAWAWVVNATKATGEAIKNAFNDSIGWLVKTFGEIKVAGAEAFATIGEWVAWLVQKFNELKAVGAETFASIGEWISNAFGKLSSVFGPILGGIIDKLKGFGGEVSGAFNDAMNLDFSGVMEIAAKFIPSLIGFLIGGIPRLLIVGMNMISTIADGMGVTVPELMDKVVSAVTGVIDGFVAKLPLFLDAGIQIIMGIINGILKQIPKFIDVITQIVNTITETLTTILPQLIDAGIQILTTLIGGMVTAIPQLLTAVIQVITALITAIVAFLPVIINAGIDILMALIDGIIQMLPVIIETAITLIGTLIAGIIEALPVFIETGITLVGALIEGIMEVLPLLITAAIGLVISIATALIKMLPAIIDAGIQILMALIEGIIKVLPILIAAALQLLFAIIDALITNLPKIIDAGIKLVMALISGLIKILPMLVTAAFTLITALIGGIIKMLPQILKAGADLIVALVKGVLSIIGQVGKAAVDIGGKILSELRKIDLFEIGKNIIDGMIRGIKNMAGKVGEAVKNLAAKIPQKIKDFLGIHSPSRVLMELGEFTGEGFARGIGSMIRRVEGASLSLANAALPEGPALSLAYETPRVGSMAVGMQSNYEVTNANDNSETNTLLRSLVREVANMKFVMDGQEVGRIVEPHIDTMQADKFNIRARMGGMKR